MAALGNQQYWEPLDDSTFAADHPVSALQAVLMRENIAHLISVAPQYRVNWASAVDNSDAPTHTDGSSQPTIRSFRFPVTVPERRRTCNLDVIVGGFISGSTTSATYRARIQWDTLPPQASTAAATSDVIWESSASTSSTSATWVIDTQVSLLTALPSYLGAMQSFSTDDDGTRRQVRMPIARLDIICEGTYTASGTSYISAAMVREFV